MRPQRSPFDQKCKVHPIGQAGAVTISLGAGFTMEITFTCSFNNYRFTDNPVSTAILFSPRLRFLEPSKQSHGSVVDVGQFLARRLLDNAIRAAHVVQVGPEPVIEVESVGLAEPALRLKVVVSKVVALATSYSPRQHKRRSQHTIWRAYEFRKLKPSGLSGLDEHPLSFQLRSAGVVLLL